MGASDCVNTYPNMTEAQVRKVWEQDQEAAEHEYGHGAYSGTIATMHGAPNFYDNRLATQDEAYQFCIDKHEKWDAAIACSYLMAVPLGKRDETRIAKAEKKVEVADDNLNTAWKKIRAAFLATKSKNVGCGGCGSSLNRVKLCEYSFGRPKWNLCPLCQNNLLSATAHDRLAKLQEKLLAAQAAIIEARKPKPGKKVGWCVGGWAAS